MQIRPLIHSLLMGRLYNVPAADSSSLRDAVYVDDAIPLWAVDVGSVLWTPLSLSLSLCFYVCAPVFFSENFSRDIPTFTFSIQISKDRDIRQQITAETPVSRELLFLKETLILESVPFVIAS